MSESIVIELTGQQANWVRDAVAHERERLPDESDHYDPEEIESHLQAAEDEINEAIESRPIGEGLLALLRAGCSPPEAMDYYMVEYRGLSQSDWGNRRGVDQSTVSENVAKAREKIDG